MDTDLRKRSGDLAAQLAAEVRAGRPERARLRAYCGCEAARFVLGLGVCSECGTCCVVDTAGCLSCPLDYWMRDLQRLAWAPPLWVPCSTCGCGADCPTLSSHPATVDPAQWVLAVAACGVARAVLPKLTTLQGYYVVERAIEAAEQWTRCPCDSCAEGSWLHPPDGDPLDWWYYLRLMLWDLRTGPQNRAAPRLLIAAAAQIIGPDATREAAAQAVLEVV